MKNKLFLISGHSGSGKTSIMREVMDNELTSFTTRPKREGEFDGVDYYFISKQNYDSMLKNNQLTEYTKYGGNYYGLSKQEIYGSLKQGDAYCIVDFNGMQQLKESYENCVTIFLHTPKEQAIEQMRKRRDTGRTIQQRMSTYEQEISNKRYYDYAVVNRKNRFNQTKKIVEKIIEMERSL